MIENVDDASASPPALSSSFRYENDHPNRYWRAPQHQRFFPNSPLHYQSKPTVPLARGVAMNHSAPRMSTPRTHSSLGIDTSSTTASEVPSVGSALDPSVLKGLTLAGLSSTILHTLAGLQAEQKILVSISEGDASLEASSKSNPLMIRSTHVSKLQHDFMIRMMGTCIILYCSLYPPFQRKSTRHHLERIGLMGFVLVSAYLAYQHIPQASVIYEWMRVLYIVVLASPVINDVCMQDSARIQFMMSGQVINFVTTLLVRFFCELVFASNFGKSGLAKMFVNYILAALSCLLFVLAQNVIVNSQSLLSVRYFLPSMPRVKRHNDVDSPQQCYQRPIEVRRLLRDFCYSRNVRNWIGMQVFLEIEMSVLYLIFLHAILYPMDDVGNSRIIWTLFRIRKVDTILVYIPMYTFGYAGVYWTMFCTIGGLCLLMLFTTSSESVGTVYILTIVFYISATAVHSAGFNLAMSDLTLSLRQSLFDRRIEEPNIAGILISMSSLICKPITYFISGIVANILQRGQESGSLSTSFYCLTIIPLVCSALQVLFWRRYDLLPQYTAMLRNELDLNIPK